MSDTTSGKDLIALDELLRRRGWNTRTVRTYLKDSDRVASPAGAEELVFFSLARVETVEKTDGWKTHAENLERKREKQKQRELERWERERPTYLEAGEMELGQACRIAIPSFPGLQAASPDSPIYDLAVLDPLAGGPWKAVIYRVQGRGEERLTFSLFAFSKDLVSVELAGEATDDDIRASYPFLIPTWEPSLFEEDYEAAFKAVETERIPWERIWGPSRVPFRLLALLNTDGSKETIEYLLQVDHLFQTTRRKRKNTPYNAFVREGHHLFPNGCAVPASGAEGIEGIFVHRCDKGLIDGIWIDLDFSEERK